MNKFLSPKNYIKFATDKLLASFRPFISRLEEPLLEKYGNQCLKHQPVFIIGAPRTGSTILYQTLTNLHDILYIDNLVCKFYRNFLFGFWLSNKLLGSKPHNNFKSDHGSTKGLHSPSECGQFWYRWLPKDHHFIDYDEITQKMVEEIRLEITAVINYFDRPLLFKNLNGGQRMRLLTKAFPKAKFLFITREPVHTAQSILKSKRNLGLNDNDFWSIKPPNVKELEKLDGFGQIVNQVYYLEKQIVEDSLLVDDGCFCTVQFKDLSPKYIDEIAKALGFTKRHNPMVPNIHINETVSINLNEFNLLQEQVKSLDWNFIQNSPEFSSLSSTCMEVKS